MVRLKAGMRRDRLDRFREAVGVIRQSGGDRKAESLSCFKKFSGIRPMLRLRFMGYQDPGMFILHHHHTMVRPQWVGAVNMPLRRRREGKQWLQHLLWGRQMRANVINPSDTVGQPLLVVLSSLNKGSRK